MSATLLAVNFLETMLPELIRLGLRGDLNSFRRLTKQLLRRTATELGADHSLCRAISALLAEDTQAQQLTRGASQAITQTNGHQLTGDPSSLVRVDQIETADNPVLAADAAEALDQLIAERQNASALQKVGLEPSRTILLVGPPGVGKTMTARYLATMLKLPLFSIELGAVMSSYLGRSGRNLREAIVFSRSTPCVFLMDEFDSIAKRRDDPADIGELKRVVNLLLLELDQWPSTGLLIAATNHPELLDRAIWRRFDRVIEFGLPSAAVREKIVARELERFRIRVDERAGSLGRAAIDTSGSDLARMVQRAVREAVLSGGDAIALLERQITQHLLQVAQGTEDGRWRFAAIASKELAWTQREIATVLGVTHVAVGKMLRKGKERSGTTMPRSRSNN